MEQERLKNNTSEFVQTWRAIDELYAQYAKSVGLTYIGLIILDTLYRAPNTYTQKEISEKTGFPKQTININIRYFLEKGYIELRELREDRRSKAIEFTQKGIVYSKEIIGRLQKIEESVMKGLSSDQKQLLTQLLVKTKKQFEELMNTSPHHQKDA